jgi:hypothetical protein
MRTRRLRYLAVVTAVAGTVILSAGASAAQAAPGAGGARADGSGCSDFQRTEVQHPAVDRDHDDVPGSRAGKWPGDLPAARLHRLQHFLGTGGTCPARATAPVGHHHS